jgi:hypothetical protein
VETPVITREQYLDFFVRTLTGMADIVRELGDDRANRRLPLPGANTPYAVLNHSLGAIGYWIGEVVHGRPAHRDRDAEFTASGPVVPLLARVDDTIGQLRQDVAAAGNDVDSSRALLHVYTDVVQHLGQLQIMRDALVAADHDPHPMAETTDDPAVARRRERFGTLPERVPADHTVESVPPERFEFAGVDPDTDWMIRYSA